MMKIKRGDDVKEVSLTNSLRSTPSTASNPGVYIPGSRSEAKIPRVSYHRPQARDPEKITPATPASTTEIRDTNQGPLKTNSCKFVVKYRPSLSALCGA